MRGGCIPNDRHPKRKSGIRKPLRTIYAIVEGTSEKVYLTRLHGLNPQVSVRSRVTKEKKATDIVAECIRLSSREGLMSTDIRAVIFDCDAISHDDMKQAFDMAEKNGVMMITSNLCFEYWLLLHFEEPPMRLDTGTLYNQELSKMLGRTYSKSEGLKGSLTLEAVADAISRSRKRLPSGDPLECHSKLNSTCMHVIAESILLEK